MGDREIVVPEKNVWKVRAGLTMRRGLEFIFAFSAGFDLAEHKVILALFAMAAWALCRWLNHDRDAADIAWLDARNVRLSEELDKRVRETLRGKI